ncbi:MAG: hypothetical protein NTU76_03120 [Candidatus Taylorbacteria bacterium]|nr:hypothetical protein [Candidatus Taylorbacteria bacterium]
MRNEYLKAVSRRNQIEIAPTSGTGMIAGASDVFTGGIDHEFVTHGKNVKGKPTKRTKVQVFQIVKKGTFAQILGGFGEKKDRLCFEQEQIKFFVRDHTKWLAKDRIVTFFLFRGKHRKFLVARVDWDMGKLGVEPIPLLSFVWSRRYPNRFVFPQL